jgi:hypothetical protein
MSLLNVPLPELDSFPIETRRAIIESFNTSPQTAALRDRLGKWPFRIGAILAMPVIAVMILVYDSGTWPCMLAGFICVAVGVPTGLVIQLIILRRALKRYVEQYSSEPTLPHS